MMRFTKRKTWFGLPIAIAVFTMSGGWPATAQAPADPTADRVVSYLQTQRAKAGFPALERRAVLDAVAQARAERIAALPHNKRLALGESIESRLEEAGITLYRRASTHMDMNRGYVDPGGAFLRNWREYSMSWSKAMDAGWTGVGGSTHVASDDWTILVVVFVEDLPSYDDLRDLELRTIEIVNDLRQDRGLTRLSELEQLTEVARGHSSDMARRGYFRHVSPEGKKAEHRVRAGGVRYRSLAENIQMSRGYEDPVRKAVDSWLDSRSHRKAMLTPGFLETGVGVALAEDGTLYFTQLFILRHPSPNDEEPVSP
jgi:uncharacterized protein YkwD